MAKKPTIKDVKPPVETEGSTDKKERKKRESTSVPPPDTPLLWINDAWNPLLGQKRMKVPLCVALANALESDEHLFKAVVFCGITKRSGMSFTSLDTAPLLKSEWSGKGYGLGTGRAQQKNGYNAKHPERVAQCKSFADAVAALIIDGGDINAAIATGKEMYDKHCKELSKEG